MRLDLRQTTYEVAQAELELNGTCLAFISEGLVMGNAGEWSPPVQVRLVPDLNHPGIVDIEVKQLVSSLV